jgi:hypothetical protein
MPPTTKPMTTYTATEWLRVVLPGTWRVLATTFPLRRTGRRLSQTITYRVLPGEGLRLRHEVRHLTRCGTRRRTLGTDRYDPRIGRFVRRSRGPLWPVTSRWSVEHISHDGELGERLAPVDIGLSGMDFADLTWLAA